jgi:pre-60S factor REI1
VLFSSKPASCRDRTCDRTGSESKFATHCGSWLTDRSISNLRRRVAGLPSLSEDQYPAQAPSSKTIPGRRNSDEHATKRLLDAAEPKSGSEAEHMPSPDLARNDCQPLPATHCLFCNLDFPTLDANMEHMSGEHGLFIPSPERLSDTGTLLKFLAFVIFEYKECLYCGLVKSTVEGVQTHMRDKGHCMISLDVESELHDFWDPIDSEGDEDNQPTESAAIKFSDTEMRLPSGIIINSRSDVAQLRVRSGLTSSRTKSSQHRTRIAETRPAITAGEETQDTRDEQPQTHSKSSDRRVAVRGELGFIGLSDGAKRALMVTEKKMMKREAIAKSAHRHAMEQQPTKTMYYKVRVTTKELGNSVIDTTQTENPVYQAG